MARSLPWSQMFSSQTRPSPQTEIALLTALATTACYRRGQEIQGAGEPATHWYRVISGMARQYTLFSDGRRQIVAFLLPDDFFGFCAGEQQDLSVGAVTEGAVVARYSRQLVERLAASDLELSAWIRRVAFEVFFRMQMRTLSLGRMTALEKVGSFLIEMSERTPRSVAANLHLEMPRHDIADYLALSVETVSRALTELRLRGSIELSGSHEVRIVDDLLGLGDDGDCPDRLRARPAIGTANSR